MAEQSLSQTLPHINDNPIHIDFLNGGTPVVLSTDVARHFQRRHSHILRDIDRLRSILPKSFNGPNFGLVEIPDAKGEKRPAYKLTRDAFSLLVMGMTGKAAIVWKLRYIEAFNALEAAALESRAELAREAGYQQGMDAGRASALPDVKAAEARGRAEGLTLGMALRPARRDKLLKMQRYMGMGLSIKEICLLLGLRKSAAYSLMHQARELGLLPPRQERPALPMQGSLLEVEA